jgi:hypothetical protein
MRDDASNSSDRSLPANAVELFAPRLAGKEGRDLPSLPSLHELEVVVDCEWFLRTRSDAHWIAGKHKRTSAGLPNRDRLIGVSGSSLAYDTRAHTPAYRCSAHKERAPVFDGAPSQVEIIAALELRVVAAIVVAAAAAPCRPDAASVSDDRCRAASDRRPYRHPYSNPSASAK